MEKIITKYFLLEGSVLVSSMPGPNGVDCWFDTKEFRQHRCLSYEDYELVKSL